MKTNKIKEEYWKIIELNKLIWDYRNGDITFNELLDKRNKLKEQR